MSRFSPHKTFFGFALISVFVAVVGAFGSVPELAFVLARIAGAGADPIGIVLSVGAGALGKRWYVGVPIAAGIAAVIGLLLGLGIGTVYMIVTWVFWAFVGDFVAEMWWRRAPAQAEAEE